MLISSSRIGAHVGLCSLVAVLCLSVACDDTSDDMGDGASETMVGADDATSDNGDGDGDPGDGDGDGGGLSYEADIQPIWDDNCVTGCHVPMGIAAFRDLSAPSYEI